MFYQHNHRIGLFTRETALKVSAAPGVTQWPPLPLLLSDILFFSLIRSICILSKRSRQCFFLLFCFPFQIEFTGPGIMTVVPFPVPHKTDRQPAFRILRALPCVMDSHPFFQIIHGKSRIECAVLAAHHVSKIFLFHLFLLAAGSKRAPNCLHLGVWSPHGHACRRPRFQTAVLLPLYCIQTIKRKCSCIDMTAWHFFFISTFFHVIRITDYSLPW